MRATSGSVATQVEKGRDRLLRIQQVGVHVHVEDVGAAADLLERDLDGLLEVAGFDQPPEPGRAGDVRSLADHDEVGVREDPERLEPAEPRHVLPVRDMSRGLTPDCVRDRLDVLGSRAAAAADDVHQPVLGELAQEPARVCGLLVVRAHLVRQAGVRMARHPGRGDAREVLDERPHLHRAERAVDADDERLRVLDREPERVDCLAGQVAAAAVDRGEGDPERQVRRLVERCGDRRLRVQRVEDRLDQEEVDATFGEPADLLRVGVPDLRRTCASDKPARRREARATASRSAARRSPRRSRRPRRPPGGPAARPRRSSRRRAPRGRSRPGRSWSP